MSTKKVEPPDVSVGWRKACTRCRSPIAARRRWPAEVNQLNETARTQSRTLAYDVDALGFSGVLQKLKRPRRQG